MKKLILFFFMIIHLSCEKYPKSDTIVEGKVLDKNGKPFNNVALRIQGKKQKKIQVFITTFIDSVKTDLNGSYKYKKNINDGTDVVILNISINDPILNFDSVAFSLNRNKFRRGTRVEINKNSFGTISNINFIGYQK
jgi:hypothetical protein